MVSIFADGSSTGKSSKPGGWGWVIVRDGVPVACDYGGHPSTTNNVMELTAAIRGIEAFDKLRDRFPADEVVELVSDSQYVLGLASGKYNPVKNLGLAARILELRPLVDQLRWVKGHSGDEFQERCDQLAKMGKLEHTPFNERLEKHRKLGARLNLGGDPSL